MNYKKALVVSIIIVIVTMLVRLPVVLYFGYNLWQYALGWFLSILFTALLWGEVYVVMKGLVNFIKEEYSTFALLIYWGHLIVITVMGVLLFFNHIADENAVLFYVGIAALSSMVIGVAVSQDV